MSTNLCMFLLLLWCHKHSFTSLYFTWFRMCLCVSLIVCVCVCCVSMWFCWFCLTGFACFLHCLLQWIWFFILCVRAISRMSSHVYLCICDFYIFVTLCFVLFVSGCGMFVCVSVFCTRFGIVGIVF